MLFLTLNFFSPQSLCLEIERTQQASDPAELQRWSQLSSRAREELGTLQCILGSMKDNQVEELSLVKLERAEAGFCLAVLFRI